MTAPLRPAGRTTALLALAGFIGLCLLAGGLGGWVTAANVKTWYPTLLRPPGTPPDWVFGPVWTTLYVLMGTAAWRIWRHAAPGRPMALRLWFAQLLANALWTPVFFGAHRLGLALLVILGLLALIGTTIAVFRRLDTLAAGLLVPYGLWTCYATYLNAGFAWLNPG